MAIAAGTLQQLASALQVVVGPSSLSPGETLVARLLPPEISGLSLPDVLSVATPPLNSPVTQPVVATVDWHVYDDQAQPLQPGTDFIALDGLGGTTAGFLLAPDLVELTAPVTLEPTIRYVQATVTLTAGAQSITATVPAAPAPGIPVAVLPLPVPTVLVLYQHVQFLGDILVVVPYSSPLASIEVLRDVLESLHGQTLELVRFPLFASMLLGLETLSVTLAGPVRFLATNPNAVPAGNGIPDFGGISLVGGEGANDRFSSLILLGPHKAIFEPFPKPQPRRSPSSAEADPGETIAGTWHVRGRSIQCFTDADYSGGSFVASVESGAAVIIPSFDVNPLWSIPLDQVKVCQDPPTIPPIFGPGTFNDSLSSVRFAWGLVCGEPIWAG